MNIDKPLLTIAVPTYNRASSLRRSLLALVKQVDALEGGWDAIEVIVSDNCSTDDTPAVVELVKDRPRVRHFRNQENLGMEGNFISCFDKAQGKYVWTFSDDDLLVDDALPKIVQLLRDTPVDLVYVPARYVFGELDSFSAQPVDFRMNRVSDDIFALRANGVLSFLSSVIVNKDRYVALHGTGALHRYKGTFLAHYEWIYALLADGTNFFIASQPLIRARTGATGGYDLFRVFGEFYVQIGRDKLANKPTMRRILELAMLYIHIPGFIKRCRENTFGKFQYSPAKVAQQILDAYGNTLFYRVFIRTQLFGSDRSAALAFSASRLYAKFWSVGRRLRHMAWRRHDNPHTNTASVS
jgi:abequosyltransferase